MFRINSISPNMITFQVVMGGQYSTVQLLPRNFVMSEVLTPQIKNLAASKAVRYREVRQGKSETVPASKTEVTPEKDTADKFTETKATVTTAPAADHGGKKK